MVTGCAGFIGSHLTEALLGRGERVLGIDNLLAGKRENMLSFEEHPRFTFIQGDVRNEGDLEKCLTVHGRPDVIYHNACSKKTVSMADPAKDLTTNALGALRLLEFARRYDVGKFVHASTGSVYGEPVEFPQTEKHPLNPVSHYGVSKLAGERYVSVYNHLYGLDTTILRYFHVYGPRQDSSPYGGVCAIFIRRIRERQPLTIFGDGTQLRSFTFVGDVVEANLRAAENGSTRGKVFNCASGLKVTVRDLAAALFALTEMHLPIKYEDWMPGDIRLFDVDSSLIRKTLGMEFTSLRTGLKRTLEAEALA